MHLAFTFYLIIIREYANVQCLGNLINLFLRQSWNVNQSCATSARNGADQRWENQLKAQAEYWNTVSSLFCPFSSFSPGTEWFIWWVNLELRTGSGGWVHFGPCFWSARLWRGTGCSPSRTSESTVWEVRQGEQICLIQGESHQSMGPQSTSHCFQPTIIKITY